MTGRLDAFQWKVPLAGIAERGRAVIEPSPSAPPRSSAPAPLGDNAASAGRRPAGRPPRAEPAPSRRARRGRRAPPKPEAVIPLVIAPDDPDRKRSRKSEPNADAQNGAWRKIFE